MKILVIRFSSIGDIVLTTPVIRCLKKQLPEAEIHYYTKPSFAPILESNPYIHKVHVLPESGLIANSLKGLKFDHIVDLHCSFRSRVVRAKIKGKSSGFSKLNFRKFLLVTFGIDTLPDIHIVDRYFQAVKPLGIQNDKQGLDYFIASDDEVNIESLPETHRQTFTALVAGATFATKRLPLHKLAELAEKIEGPIVILGGKTDTEAGEYLEKEFAGKAKGKIFNACGKFNLNQSASLLQKAEVVYTHDTGLMHIAAALKKNIVSIWGNTVPAFGMYPYLTNYQTVENKGLSCRPCSKLGYDTCPKGHFKCMEELNFDSIFVPSKKPGVKADH